MKTKKDFFIPGNDPGYMVHYLDTQLKIGLQRAFNAKGFSFTAVQFGILSLLWQKEGLHQSELAKKAGKDRHNMTRLLNLLEKGGYIQRKPDSIDKRRYNIFLTELGKSLQDKLIQQDSVRGGVVAGERASAIAALEGAGFSSAVAVPMMTQEKVVGLLAGYGDSDRTDLDEDDLQLATVLASTAAMGYANAISWRQLEESHRDLEEKIEERAGELKKSLEESRRLATDLEQQKGLLETAYRNLEALDEVKNQLISRLSLDLRMPITSLFTAAKIVRREKEVPPDKADRLLTIIYDESEKLMEIVQSVFQAAVIATNARELTSKPVPAQELFRKAIAPLRELSQDRDVRIQVLVPSGLETITCEPESTEAALRAVIKNGVEFSESGEVKLEVRRVTHDADPWLQLRVSDSGPGIGEQDLPHVFEPFWQGEDSQAGKRHGIGLGLTIAKRVMDNHGGSISINAGDNGGTEVVMSIPQRATLEVEETAPS